MNGLFQKEVFFYLVLPTSFALTLWLISRYRKDLQAKNDSLQTGSQIYSTALGPVEAIIEGEGLVVSIMHGGGGGYDRGQNYAHPEWGFKYICISRPGYLRTPLSSGKTPTQQADLLAALLDKLGIEKTVVMGVSAGGGGAIEFALRYPDRCNGLILSSAVHQPMRRSKVFLFSIAKFIIPSSWTTWLFLNRVGLYMLRPNLGLQLFGDSQKQAQIKKVIGSLWPPGPRFEGLMNDVENIQNGRTYPFSEIRVPTLVIHGSADAIISQRQGRFAAEKIPNAKFVGIRGGTHFCLVSHSEIADPALINFIEEMGQ